MQMGSRVAPAWAQVLAIAVTVFAAVMAVLFWPASPDPLGSVVVVADAPNVQSAETNLNVPGRGREIVQSQEVTPQASLEMASVDLEWRIHGVVRSEAGDGIPRATVTACEGAPWSASTDANGQYEFRTRDINQVHNTSAVCASATGYLHERVVTRFPLDLIANRDLSCDIHLRAGVSVPVRVVVGDGVPVEGVRVTLKSLTRGAEGGMFTSVGQWQAADEWSFGLGTLEYYDATSGSDGRAQLRVPQGTFRLNAWKPGLVWNPQGSRDLIVVPGMAEVVVQVDSGRKIHGRVQDPEGVPLEGVEICAWQITSGRPNARQIMSCRTGYNGDFVLTGFRESTDACDILLKHPQFASTYQHQVLLVDGVVWTMDRGSELRLRLLDSSTGAPATIVGAVKLSFRDERLFSRRQVSGILAEHGLEASDASVDSNVVLIRRVPKYAKVCTVDVGGYDQETIELPESSGQPPADVLVHLQPSFELEIRVVDSSSGSGIRGSRLEVSGSKEVSNGRFSRWAGYTPEIRLVNGEERFVVKSRFLSKGLKINCAASHPSYVPIDSFVVKEADSVAPESVVIVMYPKP